MQGAEGAPVVTAQKRRPCDRGPSNIKYTDNLQELGGGLVVLAALAQVALEFGGVARRGRRRERSSSGGRAQHARHMHRSRSRAEATHSLSARSPPGAPGGQRAAAARRHSAAPETSGIQRRTPRTRAHARTYHVARGPAVKDLGDLLRVELVVQHGLGARRRVRAGGQPCRQACRAALAAQSAARQGGCCPAGMRGERAYRASP